MKTQLEIQRQINKVKFAQDTRGRIFYDDRGHECSCGGKVRAHGQDNGGSAIYRCSKCGAWTLSGL